MKLLQHMQKAELENQIIERINRKWYPELFKEWYALEKELARRFFVEVPEVENFCQHTKTRFISVGKKFYTLQCVSCNEFIKTT